MTRGPLQSWRCDTCGEAITDPEMALVVWRTGELQYRDFLIVHKSVEGRRCDPEARAGYTGNLELSSFLGPPGLARLLSWLSAGPIKDYPNFNRVQDFDQYVDLVRRVQTPWYEEARPYFDDEKVQRWLRDANEYYPYLPEVLERGAEERQGQR